MIVKINWKYAFISFLLFLFAFLLVETKSHADTQSANIIINGQEKIFETEPMIVNGRLLVPLRGIFEDLGAKVSWKQDSQAVKIIKDEVVVELKLGERVARKNQTEIEMDVSPVLNNNRTYVPLRFITQAFGASVTWSSETKTATIFYNESEGLLAGKIKEITNQAIEVGGIAIETPLKTVIEKLGKPLDIFNSKYQFEWYIYHDDYDNYLQIGIKDEKVVAFYTNAEVFHVGADIGFSSTKKEVRARFGDPITAISKGSRSYQYQSKEEWDLFLLEDKYYVTIFYDIHEQNTVTSLYVVKKQIEHDLDGFYGVANEALRASFEKQMFYLVNATRVRNKLKPLSWNELAAETARNHSEDMAQQSYFAHESLDGRSPFDRMDDAKINYLYAGENLAMGQFNAIFAHEGLMNSFGHRKNVLNPKFNHLGVGVGFQNNRPYFTQTYFGIVNQ